MSARRKVLVIALDSAEPELIFKWGQAGLLPNLGGLLNDGAWSSLTSPPGFGAGATWPSVFTGVNIANHGRYFFEQLKPGSYRIERVSDEASVRAEPLWKRLSDAGRRVLVVDGDRAPLAEGLNGCQITNWMAHDPNGPIDSWPPSFAAEVVARFGTDPVNGHVDLFTGGNARSLDLRDRLVGRVPQKTAMARHYLHRANWDFAMISYADSHDIGHMCWHLHDPAHHQYDPQWVRAHGDPVEVVYRALDAATGELLGSVDDNVIVVVFTGPGMEAGYTANYLLTPVLQRLQGRSPARASGAGARLSAIYKQRLPFALRRRVEACLKRKSAAARETARSHSRYFQIPHNQNSGAIRINLAGREPNGIVQPGAEYDACCETLRQDLMALVDVDSGRRIVRDVVKVRDQFQGRYLDLLPDLMVVWERIGPLRAVTSEKTGCVEKTYGGSRTGDHSDRCLLVVRGPGIKPGEMSRPPAVEEIAPTLARMLEVELDPVDGQSFLDELSA